MEKKKASKRDIRVIQSDAQEDGVCIQKQRGERGIWQRKKSGMRLHVSRGIGGSTLSCHSRKEHTSLIPPDRSPKEQTCLGLRCT